ncbi:hypothetical protein [Asaia platycodi]|uniref:hypothetical protein n=1 Tax=Asaia platycodi TaxID=610243 RepID=UPI0011DD30F2|nr:hypothetical protein [Asaia platycodi]
MKKNSSWPGTSFLSRHTSHGLTALIRRNVSVMNTENRKRLSVSHPLSHPSSYDFSTDGSHLAIKSTSGHIVIIDQKLVQQQRISITKKRAKEAISAFHLMGSISWMDLGAAY